MPEIIGENQTSKISTLPKWIFWKLVGKWHKVWKPTWTEFSYPYRITKTKTVTGLEKTLTIDTEAEKADKIL